MLNPVLHARATETLQLCPFNLQRFQQTAGLFVRQPELLEMAASRVDVFVASLFVLFQRSVEDQRRAG